MNRPSTTKGVDHEVPRVEASTDHLVSHKVGGLGVLDLVDRGCSLIDRQAERITDVSSAGVQALRL